MSWNAGGLTRHKQLYLQKILQLESPDVVCIQEAKGYVPSYPGYTTYKQPDERVDYEQRWLITFVKQSLQQKVTKS